MAALRAAGFRALGYIDDFAAAPPGLAPASAASATAGRAAALKIFSAFGLQVAPDKGTATGTQALPLLGFVLDTRRQLLLLPPSRVTKFQQAARHLLHHAAHHCRWSPFSQLRRFCGLGVSTLQAVPLARFHLRALYDALRGVAPRRDARLDAQSLRDLRWWQALGSDDSVGRALWNGPSAGEVTTDASPYGWGATFQRLVPARGYFQPDVQDWHINAKELAAVRLAVLSFTPLFRRGSRLAVRTDSRVTMGVLNTMCSRSPALMAEVRRLQDVLASLGLHVEATWLPTLANAEADRLSRDSDRTDWRLCPAVFAALTAHWGACTVDRFATIDNTQLPRYNSKECDPGCEAVDVWRQPWRGESNFVNPPFSQAGLAVRKIAADQADAIAILPVWRAQPWWAEARARAGAVCFLPSAVVHYTHGRARDARPNPGWTTAAFLLRRGGRAWPPAAGVPLCAATSWTDLAATPRRAPQLTCSCRR